MKIYKIKDDEKYIDLNSSGFDKYLLDYLDRNNKKILDITSEEFDLVCDEFINRCGLGE